MAAGKPTGKPAAAAGPAGPAAPSKKVSVVGLPEELTEENVVSIFGKYGEVVSVVLNKKIRRSEKTSTVVTFVDAASATNSLVLDKATVNSKVVSVRLVRPRTRKPAGASTGAAAAASAPAIAAAGGRGPRAARVPKAASGSAPAPKAPKAAAAAAAPVVDPTSVAVSGLVDTPPENIAEHFGDCGEIDSIRFVARGTVALVKFTSASAVSKALALNGSKLGDVTLTVEPPRPRAPRAPRAAGGAAAAASGTAAAPRAAAPRRAPASEADAKATVWAGNVPAGTTEDALKGALAKFGNITKVFLGKERPFAFVTFESEAAAKAAATAGSIAVGANTVTLEGQRGRLYVGGVPEGTTSEAVTAALSVFGALVSAEVKGTSAFVVFAAAASASAAIQAGKAVVAGAEVLLEAPRLRRRRPRVVA